MSVLGRLSPFRRLPTKPRPPIATVGVWFTANCMHMEIVDRVDEAAKRVLVDKETCISRILAKRALL